MLDDVYWARRSMQEGDHEWSMMHVYYLGIHRAESRIVKEHARTFETGEKQRNYLSENREKSNRERHNERAAEWARWNEAAAEIWQETPTLKISEVASRVKKRLNPPDTIRTIRARLKKVGKAG
jgi:hypothetical protein